MAEEHVVQEKALRRFCEQVLTKLGVPAEDARVTTDVLVLADLRGIDSHGVARLGRYVNGLKQGTMKTTDQSRIIREAKATALIDGGQSLGQVVGKKGMDLAIRKARDTAVGVVAVRNSNHYGIAGYYSLMALEHDLIGVSMTNAGPLVVPTFGRTSILGTNPISLAAPALKEKAFVLDMATSTVPRGKVEVYNRLGQPMPHGWAVDETGRSSTDPARVLNALAKRLGGGLLPLGGEGEDLGGHKGYGLALMVDVLCGVLSGAATGLQVYADEKKPNVGHFFMALDPDGVPAARRVPRGHGPACARAERESESARSGADLRSRREELRTDGEVPQTRNPAGSESRRRPQEDRNRPRHPVACLTRLRISVQYRSVRVFGFSLPKGVLPVAHHGARRWRRFSKPCPKKNF